MKLDIPYLIENMTLEEKAGLCSGLDVWHTKAVTRLDVPSVMVSDGPHGIRKQDERGDNLGMMDSVEAVCFPTGSALAASFDRTLIEELGECLGEAARAEGLHTLLGPAVNIKRSPLCGRNFEYLSEDPFLAGELTAGYVKGVQSKNVGVCIKHYAANNQEYRRMSIDTIVSERALREIYLAAFEKAVKKAKPWSLMCAYNRINGEYCCENEWLLNKVLRQDWGFDGIVMTDWGAMNDRVKAIKAGLNLEMPSSHGYNDKKIVAAVENGTLAMETLDKCVEELLKWIDKGVSAENEQLNKQFAYNKQAHHAFARKTAAECAVLLKNDNALLPLKPTADTVFIGAFAKSPRYQGGGSSHVNSYKITNAFDTASETAKVSFVQGYNADGISSDETLIKEAVTAAKAAENAVIFAGLPESYESEGYDRSHLNLPECQNELIAAVCAVQPNTVVVLHNGSPIAMPWIDGVSAVLEMYLGGQASGEAVSDLLFGISEPSGRLAETFPIRLEDTPSFLNFPGDGKRVVYAEDTYVGYRWYDSRNMPVLFPFGHGLSYTTFDISKITVSKEDFDGIGTIEVTVDVTNTGTRHGKHVVQLYIAPPADAETPRAVHELKGFEKIAAAPGETKTVSFTLDSRSFSYYNEDISDWYMESGEYTIQVGSSSRELTLEKAVKVTGEPLPFVWADYTTIGDIIKAGKRDAIAPMLDVMQKAFGVNTGGLNDDESAGKTMMEAMITGTPIHSLISFAQMPDNFLEELKNNS